jgi:hypothetical protein
MLTAVAWKRNFFGRERLRAAIASADMRTVAGKIMASSIAAGILAILLLWSFGETLAATPYYLSYFNQFGGGVKNGYRFVTDSNYDWGQDLLRLRDWVKSNPEVDKIAVDYFGGGNPKYYLQDKEEDWWSSKGNPANSGIHYLAISVNSLQGAIQPAAAGFERKPEDEYRWLTSMRPPMPGMGNIPQWDYRIGTSIFIYKI